MALQLLILVLIEQIRQMLPILLKRVLLFLTVMTSEVLLVVAQTALLIILLNALDDKHEEHPSTSSKINKRQRDDNVPSDNAREERKSFSGRVSKTTKSVDAIYFVLVSMIVIKK